MRNSKVPLLLAFNLVANRAKALESERKSFDEPLIVNVPARVITFISDYTDALEEQLAQAQIEKESLQNQLVELQAIYNGLRK